MGWQADGKIMYLSAKCRKYIILGALVWSRGMAGRRKDNVYGQKSEIIHDVPGSVICTLRQERVPERCVELNHQLYRFLII